MASLVSRLVACLVAVVAILQLVHLVLLNKLESRRLHELHHLQQQHQYQKNGHLSGNDNLAAVAPIPPEEQDEFDGVNNKRPLLFPATEDLFYNNVIDHKANVRLRKQVVGNNNALRSKLDGAGTYVFQDENALMTDKLLREDEGAIVDSTGEYRIVFEVAGPKVDISGQSGSPSAFPQEKHASLSNTDDFLIDDDVFEPDSTVDVTLGTHSDLDGAKRHLIALVSRWQGPISLALFAPNSSAVEACIEFIAQARLCSDQIKQFVSFHLVFPLVETHTQGGGGGRPKTTRLQGISIKRKKLSSFKVDPKECQNFSKLSLASSTFSSGGGSGRSSSAAMSNYYYDSVSGVSIYPTNLLRNVARKKVLTDFSLVSDIDMLPSSGLRSKFQKFAREKELLQPNGDERKSVFVVPAFESKNGEAPETKKELLALIDKYQVRPFFFDLCWKCQMHTDYESWQRESMGLSKKGDLSVLFEVLWKDPWEPFFISDNSVPLFDERFRTTGFNRISQLCELHVAGYKFAVLNEAFLIHRGYITPQSFQPRRNRDLEASRAHFRQFKNELKTKYPHSTRRCY